jgi:hypothetical protein
MKTIFLNWLTGKPSKKKSLIKNIFGKFIVGTMWIYIFYSFSSGPGAIFASFNPIGFTKVNLRENVIHYSKDFASSMDYYSPIIKKAREIVDLKWNESDDLPPQRKPVIHFYLTSHAQDVAKLTMVNTAAVTVLGNKIVLSIDFIKKMGWDVADVLKHEISHVNCSSRYGWIRGYFNFPIWLDEGIASNFSNFPQDSEKHFNELLKINPEAISLTTLNSIFSWQSALFNNHDNFVKQYGYSRWITKDLMSTHGMHSLKQFLSGKADFQSLFGKTLTEYENTWVETQKKNGLIPEGVTLIYPSISWKVICLWTLQSVALISFILFLVLWTIRQSFKIVKAIA